MSTDSTTLDDVILEIRSMFGMGATDSQVVDYLADTHDHVPAASRMALVDTARQQMLEDASAGIKWQLACSLQRHRDLYQRALHVQDYAACLKIEQAIGKLANQLAAQDPTT